MNQKPAIGMIGIGLMGHGIAWNVANAGYDLAVLDHGGNQPLADLREMGVRVMPTIAGVVRGAEVVLLCVTGSPEVEEVLTGDGGVTAHLAPGTVVVDCSTSLPESSRRMAAAVAAAGGAFVDAAMTRLPQHARAGTLNLLVGGDPAVLARVRPLLDAFSETITHVGEAGSGHLMKLLHNAVSLGFVTLLAEVAAHGRRAGVDMATLVGVLERGGGGGAALQRIAPFLLAGDASAMPFSLGNAAKDLGYYRRAAAAAGARRAVADAVGDTLEGLVAGGHGRDLMPLLAELLGSPEP